jgi:excinuclease ABC subunit B
MYADKMTPSMRAAIDETDRRRAKQIAHNEANGISPEPLRKKIHDILDDIYREAEDTDAAVGGQLAGGRLVGGGGRQMSRGKGPVPETRSRSRSASAPARQGMARAELAQLIQDLNDQMLGAARELQFELAARIRDEVSELKKELRGMDVAGVK